MDILFWLFFVVCYSDWRPVLTPGTQSLFKVTRIHIFMCLYPFFILIFYRQLVLGIFVVVCYPDWRPAFMSGTESLCNRISTNIFLCLTLIYESRDSVDTLCLLFFGRLLSGLVASAYVWTESLCKRRFCKSAIIPTTKNSVAEPDNSEQRTYSEARKRFRKIM